MLPSYFNEVVIRIRPAQKIERGTPAFDWDNADEAPVYGCHVQPSSTSLSQDGRILGLAEGCTLYTQPDADIKEGDRIRIGDDTYTINGVPKQWTSPTGALSNMQVPLMRWSG